MDIEQSKNLWAGGFRPGFTLAELLIALAILGVIATFTIPKVLSSQTSSQNRSIIKESISSVAAIIKEGRAKGELFPSNNGSYIISRLNAVKLCSTNARTEGCWTAAQNDYGGEHTEPGIILHSGATIAGLNNTGVDSNGFILDANGPVAPNTMGQDQIWMGFCSGPNSCGGLYWNSGSRPYAVGTIGPIGNQESSDLYDIMFGQ